MNSREVQKERDNILRLLANKQLKEAIELLMKLVVNTQDWKDSEKLSELETNYKYMLHYQFEDTVDLERDKILDTIIRQLYELTDDATDELLSLQSSNIFYEKIRIEKIKNPISLSTLLSQIIGISESLSLASLLDSDDAKKQEKRNLAIKRERLDNELFAKVFISSRATEQEANDYLELLNNIDLPTREKCLFLSALTLNLFYRFDAKKVSVLLTACSNEIPEIAQRAMVGLIVILQMYDSRWKLYPECQFQLDALSEKESFRKSVLVIIKQLIRSRETEEISRKMTEEIIPEMMRFNSLAGKKLNMEDLMGETDFMDKNPDWKKELENSGLASKLQEYSSLQMEGADVFHSTFSNLKTFPFFSELSNWFLPFDMNYSELQSLSSNGASLDDFLQKTILKSAQMCNSDKYSFALSLLQIPESQRQMVAGKLGEQTEQLKELQNDAQALNPTINNDVISNQYIQDLYRFFKLYPYRSNFRDIFKLKLNFYEIGSIAPLIDLNEDMLQIANFCFDKNFFYEALNIYKKLTEKQGQNSNLWQKLGYCYQMLNNLEDALNAYLQAELLSNDNSWVIKRIAQVYKSLKNPQKALEYYQRASQFNPDNLNVEMNIGHCYLELDEYEKALNSYFKVELLDTKNNKALRPIAWTSFLLKKFDVSQRYYNTILLDKPTVHDYLNAGHVELSLNNKKKAQEYYLTAINMSRDFDLFLQLFEEDKPELLTAGNVDPNFIPLLIDSLRYKLD